MKFILLFSAGVLIYQAFSAVAQMDVGSIVGTARDQTGAVISGASVTVTNEGTNISITIFTADNGQYLVLVLKVGT